MSSEELKTYINGITPKATYEEGAQYLTVLVGPDQMRNLMERLRYDAATDFDYLFCVTGIDWKTHFTVVYHLESYKNKHIVVVKVNADRNDPLIPTVCDIWRTAELHEREVYDLFGVKFKDHPDLRRLFLDDTWGFPLRKDYVDDNTIVSL